MAVTLTINGESIEAASGRSLFEQAESLGQRLAEQLLAQGARELLRSA